jgi:hypothetical protein
MFLFLQKKPVYMIPYLMICHLGIWLLVLLTAISGFSELLIELSTGLIIIMGGSILVGKTTKQQP